ncbi:MAG TPA: hypothetical protein EYP49_00025 [Anaerolineae bacterium]|nr:hypothetical protein [Anaerolineae bacterium]
MQLVVEGKSSAEIADILHLLPVAAGRWPERLPAGYRMPSS